MLKKTLCAGMLLPVLAACSVMGAQQDAKQDPHAAAALVGGDSMVFYCENGMQVTAKHNGDDLHLTVAKAGAADSSAALLKRAVSASGERFTATEGLFGRGGEWHQKGGEAYFAFVAQEGGAQETLCKTRS